MKAVLKFASIIHGDLFVMIIGPILMLMLYVDC